MSITHVPAKEAITKTTVEVIQEAQPEKYVLELTREQFLFVMHCSGQLCSEHFKADPIGYTNYSKYKDLIGFPCISVDEKPFQKIADRAVAFYANKP